MEIDQIIQFLEHLPVSLIVIIGIILLLIVLKVARSFIKFALSVFALIILALVILKLLNQP